MVIVPSLDVRGGRLANAPAPTVVERARQLVRDGATELHLVDLDGAETGVFANLEVLSEAARAAAVPCRLAGGMCEVSRAREALERGFAGVEAVRAVVGDDVVLHTGGGVRDLDDVRALAAHGVASVVVGRALSEGRFTLREAQRAIVQA